MLELTGAMTSMDQKLSSSENLTPQALLSDVLDFATNETKLLISNYAYASYQHALIHITRSQLIIGYIQNSLALDSAATNFEILEKTSRLSSFFESNKK